MAVAGGGHPGAGLPYGRGGPHSQVLRARDRKLLEGNGHIGHMERRVSTPCRNRLNSGFFFRERGTHRNSHPQGPSNRTLGIQSKERTHWIHNL